MQGFMFYIRQAMEMLSQYDWVVAIIAVCVAAAFIREMLDSVALAVVAAPLMLVGALAANYLFQVNFFNPVGDEDTNVVIASALGILTTVALLLLSMWIASVMSERRSKHRKLLELPPNPKTLGPGGNDA